MFKCLWSLHWKLGSAFRTLPLFLSASWLAAMVGGCATPAQNFASGAAGVTLLGARTPAQEIEQIYYLGVFDPREQVPPEIYRVRVHGQASLTSGMRFGSGWVHANLVDSLSTGIKFDDETGSLTVTTAEDKDLSQLTPGRRQVLFGPEGFREAPKDHRLVIVMGSSPEAFFSAMDESLHVVSQTLAEIRHEGLNKRLLVALQHAKAERDRLDALEFQVKRDLESGGQV